MFPFVSPPVPSIGESPDDIREIVGNRELKSVVAGFYGVGFRLRERCVAGAGKRGSRKGG